MKRPGRRDDPPERPPSSASHQPGAGPVPGYDDLVEIGRGASGRVYRAQQRRLSRLVALKVLDAAPDDRDARRRFDRELDITVRLGSHPHIVQVLDAGQATDGRPFLAMELFERGSAGDWLRDHGPFAPDDAVRAGVAIADALAAAHHAGVLHRDVKPENILLSPYGPALTDFGIARPADQLDRTSSFSQFTPWHAAPEVLLDHPPTEVADVYSLASTLFTLLDGRPPFAGPAGESLLAFQRRVLSEEPRPVPASAGDDLAQALRDALARDPERRPADAAAFRDRLRAIGSAPATSRPGTVRPTPTGPSPVPPAPPVALDATLPPRTAAAEPPPAAPPPPPTPERATTSAADHAPDRPLGDRGDLSLTRAAGTTPDPVDEAAPGDHRRPRWPFVAGAALVVLVLAVVAGALWPRDDDHPAPGTTTLATVPDAPADALGTPKDVKADDRGNTVVLTWTDTTKGAGTYLVVVAAEGKEATTASLDDAVETYTVDDVDPELGYCFQVAAVAPLERGGIRTFKAEPTCIRGAKPAGDASTTTSPPETTTTAGG